MNGSVELCNIALYLGEFRNSWTETQPLQLAVSCIITISSARKLKLMSEGHNSIDRIDGPQACLSLGNPGQIP